MGANSFINLRKGIYKDVREAFAEAVGDAAYDHGHNGYTGSIAEKTSYQMIDLPKGKDPEEFIDECFGKEGFWNNKWGPAACIEIKGAALTKLRGEAFKGKRNFKAFYFFGWASS